MDYEKKYKEALERARGFYNNEECRVGMTPIDLEVIFPELRENEEEKIRKGIISTLKFANHNGIYDKYIEWLEKQDEKLRGKTALEAIKEPKDYNSIDPYFAKPIDKVEPKFYEGEWVVQGDNILKIKCVGDTYYCFETVGGYVDDMLVSEIDSQFHLWTFKDVKDGDILQLGEVTAIFKSYIGNGKCKCYCSVCNGEFEIPSQDNDDDTYGCDDAIPATKSQRDALMKAMADAGYEWNAEKKELKKIEENSFESDRVVKALRKAGYEWSEETHQMKKIELNNSDKVETKFHEGDWVVDMLGEVWKIERVLNYFYILKDVEGDETQPTIEWVNKTFHLWTIEDAKDGDILASKFNKPLIYNGKHTSRNVGAYCGITTNDKLIIASEECHWTDNFNIHPANKDQRDILMKAMNDEGYVFDFNKKELIHEYVYSN